MNRIWFLLLWSFLLPVAGQIPSDVPPGNPTQFPTGAAEWSIDITPEGSAPKGAPSTEFVTKIDVTQVDKIERRVMTWSSGQTSEEWYFKDFGATVTTRSGNGRPACIPDVSKPFWLRTGFEPSEFQWITPANYKDTISYQGKRCLHYQSNVKLGRDGGIMDPNAGGTIFSTCPYEAWIDAKTLLPVGLNDGTKLGVFTFRPDPPAGPLVPPAGVERILERCMVRQMPTPPSR